MTRVSPKSIEIASDYKIDFINAPRTSKLAKFYISHSSMIDRWSNRATYMLTHILESVGHDDAQTTSTQEIDCVISIEMLKYIK